MTERQYKDSGIEWIGELPQNWEVMPNKYLMTKQKDLCPVYNGENILSLSMKGVYVRDPDDESGKRPKTYDGYQFVYDGDLLMCLFDIDVTPRCVGRVYDNGLTSPAYSRFVMNRKKANVDYYYYYYLALDFDKTLLHLSKNMRSSFTETDFGRINAPVPPITEQMEIVNYLDSKTASIDSAIQAQRDIVEKLKEYKQAIITETVTKGLNRDAEMKNSGIEWIGEIPNHWDILRMKHVAWLKGRIGWDGLKAEEFVENGPYLITGTDFENGKVNWGTCAHITKARFKEDELLHIRENDLLITKDGTVGKVAVAKNCPDEVSLNSGVMIIRNNSKYRFHGQYMYYLLLSEEFIKWFELNQKPGSTIRHLYQHQFENFRFTFPPFDEQQKIADFLDSKTATIDKAIEQKNAIIEKLEEYKKSIIYNAVTGKIDCRKDVIPE